jgi:ribosomal protein S18 acetylase RimI-like enzyme
MAVSIIRHATPRDARELAHLGERTFREAFGPKNTAENMDLHTRERYGEAIQAGEIADPQLTTLVCEANGALIGFTQLRWEAAPPCVMAQRPGEIQRLYVSSEWHGQGIAQQLMEAALGMMQARGCDAAWLGVWEENPRAIAFYRKYGFAEVGELPFALGDDDQRDLVMARRLVVR